MCFSQLHGIDDEGSIVIRRKIRRSEILNFLRSIPLYVVEDGGLCNGPSLRSGLQAIGHEIRPMPRRSVRR